MSVVDAIEEEYEDRIEALNRRIKHLESCIRNDCRKNHFRRLADGMSETIQIQNKLLDKLARRVTELEAQLKAKDELLFAYESVKAPKLPCPDEETNRRIEELKLKIKDGVRRIRRSRSMREQ